MKNFRKGLKQQRERCQRELEEAQGTDDAATVGACRERLRWVNYKQSSLDDGKDVITDVILGRTARPFVADVCVGSDARRPLSAQEIRWNAKWIEAEAAAGTARRERAREGASQDRRATVAGERRAFPAGARGVRPQQHPHGSGSDCPRKAAPNTFPSSTRTVAKPQRPWHGTAVRGTAPSSKAAPKTFPSSTRTKANPQRPWHGTAVGGTAPRGRATPKTQPSRLVTVGLVQLRPAFDSVSAKKRQVLIHRQARKEWRSRAAKGSRRITGVEAESWAAELDDKYGYTREPQSPCRGTAAPAPSGWRTSKLWKDALASNTERRHPYEENELASSSMDLRWRTRISEEEAILWAAERDASEERRMQQRKPQSPPRGTADTPRNSVWLPSSDESPQSPHRGTAGKGPTHAVDLEATDEETDEETQPRPQSPTTGTAEVRQVRGISAMREQEDQLEARVIALEQVATLAERDAQEGQALKRARGKKQQKTNSSKTKNKTRPLVINLSFSERVCLETKHFVPKQINLKYDIDICL